MADAHRRHHNQRGRGSNRGRNGDRGQESHSNRGRESGNRPTQRERQPLSEDDQDFFAWRKGIPFTRQGQSLFHNPFTRHKLSTFMQTAQRLIELRNGNIRHQVITEMASEGGMLRVAELFDTDLMSLQEQDKEAVFENLVLPFFQTITHSDVLSSLLLEKPIGDLYVFVYGTGGRRAVTLFESYAGILQSMLHRDPPESIRLYASTILTALLQTLKSNQTAALMPNFLPVVDVLQACLDFKPETFRGTLLQQAATRHMTVVRRLLKYGEGIEPLEAPAKDNKKASFIFQLSQEGPGWLSSSGRRHDNDHEDIVNIKILPTAEEIRSQRAEYLPSKEPESWHIPGIRGMLDQQFRLLREDTVGQLRDCVRVIMESLTHSQPRDSSGKSRDMSLSLKIFKYSRVSLADVSFENQKKQLVVVATFDQPTHLQKSSERDRAAWWENSRQLQLDSLVCLLDSEGNALFFSVYNRGAIQGQEVGQREENQKVPTLWSDPSTAFITLRLIDMDNPALVSVLGRDWKSTQIQHVLVEFPGVLLPSFQPTLEALQSMSRDPDVPFSDLLLHDSNMRIGKTAWPAYATQPGFYFDFAPIAAKGDPLRLSRNRAVDTSVLKARTTLDDAQCTALVGALSRNLALMQGPPGTGKSFVAIQVVKVLLESRMRAQMNPIVCVCYTNHALDQFLEQMLEGGVTQVIRIGGRSKSSKLEAVNLRAVTERKEATKTEKQEAWQLRTELEQEGQEIESLYQQLKRASQPEAVLQYLKEENSRQYHQLVSKTDEEGFETIQSKWVGPVSKWLYAHPLDFPTPQNSIRDRPIAQLLDTDLTTMKKIERQRLHKFWVSQIRDTLSEQLETAIARFSDIEAELFKNRQEIKLRCLEEAHIIGITTSGLAKNVSLLRRLQPKVLICEEAGEILEAHTLTAFLPSIEHAILIGDHEQLRPQVQNYSLSLESPHGEKYSLDMSTFERLITTLEIPHDTLQTQRRMDPSVADLIRQTIYPTLKNNVSVMNYPLVTGVRKRLFWLDHRMPEAGSDPSRILDSSHSNDYEVQLVEALVMHLVRQGTYGAEDIVVLTPYVRQLQKLRQRLANSFEIVIGDKDQDELAKQDTETISVALGATHRAMLTQRLRISTVDNFQGEEAQVVVISLVRSNPERKCGFLRTTNRINVLLSRAKHGMYILGDSQTYKHVPMWARVIDLLHTGGNIGFSLPLCCPQHPDTLIEVTNPEDFLSRAPEGGCDLQCNLRLECGHACSFKCHSIPRHEAVICQEPCPRIQPRCGHACPKNCGATCGNCSVMMKNVTLQCGHVLNLLECHKTNDLGSIQCKQQVQREIPGCGHSVKVQCRIDVLDSKYKCNALCGANLPCGHRCQKRCHVCRKNGDGALVINHGDCTNGCGRDYTTCYHSCQAICHGDKPCPLCDERCPIQCAHSQCSKKCHEPCAPCVEPCKAGCPHQGICKMPCAVPCDVVPCSHRCDKTLACGHQCPSVCGETCPKVDFCQTCASEDIKTAIVDYIMSESYKDADLDRDPIIVPPCGHLIVRSSMDGIMDMTKHYEMSLEHCPVAIKSGSGPLSEEKIKVCPQCRGPLRQIDRYARVVKRAMLDESTRRFIVWSNAQFVPLTTRLQQEEQRLSTSDVLLDGNRRGAHSASPVKVWIQGPRNAQIKGIHRLPGLSDRLGALFVLREDIRRFLSRVRIDEQPFSKVYRMYQAALRNGQPSANGAFQFDSQVLQTRQSLLTESLLLRCDYAILSDFLTIYQKSSHRKNAFPWLGQPVCLDLDHNRSDCLRLAQDCLKDGKEQPMIAVEVRVQFAKFVALERILPLDSDSDGLKAAKRLVDGREQLDLARNIVARYPSTAAMNDEIQGVEKMLRDSTFYTLVTSAEKQAIYMAMAQDFRGTGHWYHCANGHLFTVGECGAPMQTSRCPQCGAPVGGQSHQAVEGVTRASDFEQEFGRMAL